MEPRTRPRASSRAPRNRCSAPPATRTKARAVTAGTEAPPAARARARAPAPALALALARARARGPVALAAAAAEHRGVIERATVRLRDYRSGRRGTACARHRGRSAPRRAE